MVGRWLKGAEPKPEMVRKVAKVTNHSLAYLFSVAYGIPLEEIAKGVGADVLPYDRGVNTESRKHLANQYRLLAQLPPDDVEQEGDEADPTPRPGAASRPSPGVAPAR